MKSFKKVIFLPMMLCAFTSAQAIDYKLSGQVNRMIRFADDGKADAVQHISGRAAGSHRFYVRGGGGNTMHGFRFFEGPIKNADGVYLNGERRRFFDEHNTGHWNVALGKQKYFAGFKSRLEVFYEQDSTRTQYLTGGMYPVMQRLRTNRTGINFGILYPVWGSTVSAGPVISLYHQANRVNVDNRNSNISDTYTRDSAGGRGGFAANWDCHDLLNLTISSQVSSSHESNVQASLILFFDEFVNRVRGKGN